MKTPLFALALVAGFALTLHAQEEPAIANPESAIASPLTEGSLLPADNSGSGLILYPQPSATPAATEPELAPLPEAAPEPSPAPETIKPVTTDGGIEKIRRAVRIRELKTIVLENPEVQAQKEGAHCAKTPEGRRIWMRNYYTLLYTKMEKLDPSLTPELESELHDVLTRYEQHNIYPSILIENIKELPGSHSEDHVLAKADNGEEGKKKEKKMPRLPHR